MTIEYDREKYKAWTWPHPLILHWVINPGLAFNELVLGQRLPKLMLIDKTSEAPLLDRQYVPCPSCGAMNDGRLWSGRRAFGHWFGLVCPECSGRIPCLWNWTSLLILGLTFPIWFWVKKFGEEWWLQKEKNRTVQVEIRNAPSPKKVSWLRTGIIYGVIMFSVMVLPKALNGQMTPAQLLLQGAIWLVAGLLFGLAMKLFLERKK